MKTNRCVTQSCIVRPTERVETMMMTGVKSNICIGSFVTQIFLQFTLPHSLIQCLVLTFAFEEVANGNVWSVICCRQIGWQLEFERDSNDSSHFFSVSGRALTVSGHFTTKSSFDVLYFSLSARCENASHAYTGAMPFYATTNNNCIARISCKLTIFNF